ncbi:hypothetical protein HRG_012564 [Hirsutella rhossiliensis]
MEIKSIFFALLLLVQVSLGLPVLRREVQLSIDVLVDKYTINRLAPGSRTEDLKVEYHTGFWTTGGDWWKICWTSNNATTITYTDPNNFRGAVDWFEKSISDIIPIPGSAAGGAAGFLVGKVITGLVANQATTVAKNGPWSTRAARELITRSERGGWKAPLKDWNISVERLGTPEREENRDTEYNMTFLLTFFVRTTAGFKQHILPVREGDHDTSIVIEKDGSVTFQSPSGVSTTTTTTLEVTDKLLAKHRKELENEMRRTSLCGDMGSTGPTREGGFIGGSRKTFGPGLHASLHSSLPSFFSSFPSFFFIFFSSLHRLPIQHLHSTPGLKGVWASPFSFFLIKPSLQSNTLMADSIPSTKTCRTASRRSRQINSYRRKNLPYHMEDLRLTVSTARIGEPHAPLSVRQNKLSYPRYVDKDCHY